MAKLPMVTVKYEGGFYSPDRDPKAPIRIYADRWVYDDIFGAKNGWNSRRERLTRKQYNDARHYAKINRDEGRI